MKLTHGQTQTSEPALIFNAPLIADSVDTVNGTAATVVNGSFGDARGYYSSSVRYRFNLYWYIAAIKAKLLAATKIIVEAEVTPTAFCDTIPNGNNYSDISLVSSYPYSSTTTNVQLLSIRGNGSDTAYTSLNVTNKIRFTMSNISTSGYDLLQENVTRGTSLSGTATTNLSTYIQAATYLGLWFRMWSSGGSITAYIRNVKIWVE